MIKRFFSLALLLSLTLSLCSCGFLVRNVIPDILDDIGVNDHTESTDESRDETENTVNNDTEPDSYKDIQCVETKRYKNMTFSVAKDNTVFRTSMPQDMSYSKSSESGLSIIRDGKVIGSIGLNENKSVDDISPEFWEDYFSDGMSVVHYIFRLSQGEYVHYFKFEYSTDRNAQRTVYMTVDYRELDEFSVKKILYNSSSSNAKSLPDLTSNKLASSIISRGANILILGNSFIGTSSIGNILSDMCPGHNINAISRGYATVSKTYAVDNSILSSIIYGEYDAVFLCGFYSQNDADALSEIVDVCKASATKLFVFPAHNENASVIKSAVSKYDYPVFLDWKGEIDLLIDSGISYNDFCINDAHQHSLPLAGYVGAHMIYRTLFGKMPPDINYIGNIDQDYVDQKLGSYVDTGSIDIIKESDINRIN